VHNIITTRILQVVKNMHPESNLKQIHVSLYFFRGLGGSMS